MYNQSIIIQNISKRCESHKLKSNTIRPHTELPFVLFQLPNFKGEKNKVQVDNKLL